MERIQPQEDALPTSRQWELAALAGVLAIAAVLRASRLIESFWYDEIAAFRSVQAGPWKIVTTLQDPANHILHTLLTWVAVNIVPAGALHGETILRLPAFAASIASIAAIYLLARWALEPRSALLAAMIAAAAPVSVLEGAEARGYSMMICFSAAATWQMCRLMEMHGARSRATVAASLLYALFASMGAWAHLLTVFIPAGHAVWILRCAFRNGWRSVVAPIQAILLAALFTFILYAPVLGDLLELRSILATSADDRPALFGPEGFHAVLQLGGAWYWWAALPGLLCFAMGLFAVISQRDGNQRVLHAAMLALLGLPVMIVAVWAAGSWMYARFALFALPGAVVLMTLGLMWLRQRHRIAGMLGLLLLVMCFGLDLGFRPPKQPLREAANFVRAEHVQGEGVLVIGIVHRVMDVYLEHLDPAYSPRHGVDLQEKLDTVEPVWVIVLYPESVPQSRLDLLEAAGYQEVARFRGWVDWGKGDVRVLRQQ